ncbi:MAG: type II toxin-antitoxin system Phd/YefM family antitoxin [Pseudomonadota bacterium]
MSVTTISSRSFNQDTGSAKRAAETGPVYITDRGRPAHVLLTIEAYEQLTNAQPTLVDLLADDAAAAVPFEPVPIEPGFRAADLD